MASVSHLRAFAPSWSRAIRDGMVIHDVWRTTTPRELQRRYRIEKMANDKMKPVINMDDVPLMDFGQGEADYFDGEE